MSTYEALKDYVFGLEIVDTHEHLAGCEKNRDQNVDVLAEYLAHYFSCDLVSAGLKPADLEVVRDFRRPLAERWKLAEPFWEAARFTGYGRALDIAARAIYGIDGIRADTIEPLNEAFCTARKQGGHYRRVFKKLSKIRVSILDSDVNCDREFFRSTVRLDEFIMVQSLEQVRNLERISGVAIHSLEDLKAACEAFLDKQFAAGAVTIKSGLAYQRPLYYPKVAAAAAEAEFVQIFSPALNGRPVQTQALQNYMMHHLLSLANARGLPFQFHTGLQEGNGNYITHSDPSLLTNLFIEYENVRFDIFHIGYPYEHVLSALAKNFRNVFIDFCWANIISPAASVAALTEYLDAVPANKISAFGGDYCFVDAIYGHQHIARENVARALASKVKRGVFDVHAAQHIAKMILHDNPLRIFNIQLND